MANFLALSVKNKKQSVKKVKRKYWPMTRDVPSIL